MERIRATNGYTIYRATKRDESKYNVTEGTFYVYFSSDIRDYGLRNSDYEWETDTAETAVEWCQGSNYATAREIVESQTTAATFEEIQEVEALLDSGMTREEIEEAEEHGSMYETTGEALALYRSIRHMPTRYAIYNELTGETLEGSAKVLNRAILTTEAVMGDSSFIPARADYLQGTAPTRREVETWAIIEAAYSRLGMF